MCKAQRQSVKLAQEKDNKRHREGHHRCIIGHLLLLVFLGMSISACLYFPTGGGLAVG